MFKIKLKTVKKIFLFLVFYVGSQSLWAQVNFNRFRDVPSFSSFNIEDGYDQAVGLGNTHRLYIGLSYNDLYNPYIIVDAEKGTRLFEVIRSFRRAQLALGVQVTKRLGVSLSLAMDQVESLDYNLTSVLDETDAGQFRAPKNLLGDVQASLRYRLSPWSQTWNWTLFLRYDFATGDPLYFNTDDGLSIEGGLALSKRFGHKDLWRIYSNVSYKYAPNSEVTINPLYTTIDNRQRINWGLGVSREFWSFITPHVEVASYFAFPISSDQNPIEISAGASLKLTLALSLYGGYGLEAFGGERYSIDRRFYVGLKSLLFKRDKPLFVKAIEVAQSEKMRNLASMSSFQIEPDTQEAGSQKTGHDQAALNASQLLLEKFKVFFATGKSVLDAKAQLSLRRMAGHLIKHGSNIKLLRIDGHADSQGSDEANQTLSEARALAVREFLVQHGVKPEVLITSAYGERKPAVKEQDSTDRRQNRRVLFYVESIEL